MSFHLPRPEIQESGTVAAQYPSRLISLDSSCSFDNSIPTPGSMNGDLAVQKFDMKPLHLLNSGFESLKLNQLDSSSDLFGETHVPSVVDLNSFRTATPGALGLSHTYRRDELSQCGSISDVHSNSLPGEKSAANAISSLTLASPTSLLSSAPEWQTQFFKTKLCPYYVADVPPGSSAHGKNVGNSAGTCVNGDSCRFAHSLYELRPLPDLKKTKLCSSFARKSDCVNPRCPFAHSPEELRTSSSVFYKVTLCNFYKTGKCWNGPNCRFAHGSVELRSQQYPYSASKEPSESDSHSYPYPSSDPQPRVNHSRQYLEQRQGKSSRESFYSDSFIRSNMNAKAEGTSNGLVLSSMPPGRLPPPPPHGQTGYYTGRMDSHMNAGDFYRDETSGMLSTHGNQLQPNGDDNSKQWRSRPISEAVVKRRLNTHMADREHLAGKSRVQRHSYEQIRTQAPDNDIGQANNDLRSKVNHEKQNGSTAFPVNEGEISEKLLEELCALLESANIDLPGISSGLPSNVNYGDVSEASPQQEYNIRGGNTSLQCSEDGEKSVNEVSYPESSTNVVHDELAALESSEGLADETQVLSRAMDALRRLMIESNSKQYIAGCESDSVLQKRRPSSTSCGNRLLESKSIPDPLMCRESISDLTREKSNEGFRASDIYRRFSSKAFQMDCPLSLSPVCSTAEGDPLIAWCSSASSPAVCAPGNMQHSTQINSDNSIGSLLPPGLDHISFGAGTEVNEMGDVGRLLLLSPSNVLPEANFTEDSDLNNLLSEIFRMSSEQHPGVSSSSPPIATS